MRRLWRGETGRPARAGAATTSRCARCRAPVQPELPVWVTAAGNPETFELAGELGRERAHPPARPDGRGARREDRRVYRDALARGRARGRRARHADAAHVRRRRRGRGARDRARSRSRTYLRSSREPAQAAPPGPSRPSSRRRRAPTATFDARPISRTRSSTRCSSTPSSATTRRAACSARPRTASRLVERPASGSASTRSPA